MILISKNDFIEFICKVKHHIVLQADIDKLDEYPDKMIFSVCKRCGFGITIETDPDDKDYCIVSECDY